MAQFTDAERLKFALLAEGLTISPGASHRLREANKGRPLTPADYASTSGVILWLDDDVWVNAPITDYNPNFVEESPYVLNVNDGDFIVTGDGLESRARFWLPPAYHGTTGSNSKPYNYYAFTHADRVRLSPIMGCSMACHFCNIPYEDRYGTKPIEAITEALTTALHDPLQPAHHVLISGGTPREGDIGFLKDVYEETLISCKGTEVDIMMVPIDGLLDLKRLDALGVHEFSINIEVSNPVVAARIMSKKYGQGLEWYLDYLEKAAEILGPGRVRSMLLVGLEPPEDTLAGVSSILERGCVPVLSPFRPSPSTPLARSRPPSVMEMEDIYMRALDLAVKADATLGPTCPPCTHNTLTLMSDIPGYNYRHPIPSMI